MPLKLSRREWLQLAAFSGTSALVSACARVVESTPLVAPTKFALPSTPSPSVNNAMPLTPNADFFVMSVFASPDAPPNWKLNVTGLVNQNLSLTLDELKAMPAVSEMRTLACISNPPGGELIGNAMWRGVRLRDVLARAGIKSNARFIKLESFDQFSTGIPLDLGMDEHSLLVYEMNGEPLSQDHGAPLRCLFPGRFGMKQPKWLHTITLIENESAGFWEKQGWSSDAKLLPFARIDAPKDGAQIASVNVQVSGIAFSDEAGLQKLELAWDETDAWQTAELLRGSSPLTWTAWRWNGVAPSAGKHTLFARATDNRGKTQTRATGADIFGSTFPNGSDKMHSIVLDFK